MTERVAIGISEQPIKAEVGQSFKPFEGLKLPSPIQYETYVESVNYVLSRDIDLDGTKTSIALSIPEQPIPFLPRDYSAPLGKPTAEITYDDEGRIVPLKTPLQLVSFTTLNSITNYIELSQYQFRIQMGEETYYLDCVEKIWPESQDNLKEAEEIIVDGIRKDFGGGQFVVNEAGIRDQENNPVRVVLPYDPEKLSGIEVTIIPKEKPAVKPEIEFPKVGLMLGDDPPSRDLL